MTATGKIVHIAAVVDERGNTSALCFAPEHRPIDSEREGWTSRSDEVTCPACRSATAWLASIAGRSPADLELQRLRELLVSEGRCPAGCQSHWPGDNDGCPFADASSPDGAALAAGRFGFPPLGAVPRLFLAVYGSHSGMAELNNVGFVSAPDAKAARAKACALFSVAANCASAIHITPMSELQDGWSYYR